MGKVTKGTVRKITINVPSTIYEKFKYKCYEEGYSMQKALQLLIEDYVEND